MIHEDDRLADTPMTAVRCERCGTTVHARKASWAQTSVQWNSTAMRECRERRACAHGDAPLGGRFPGCAALRDSIRNAAVSGRLDVGE